MTQRYVFKEKPSPAVREALKEYDELTQDMLFARGITTHKGAQAFFYPDYERDVYDPMLLRDMSEAVARIVRAIDTGEHIGVYTDFDADGIPAGALLHDVLAKVGHTAFTNYIPHRDTEGYGFHVGAVDALIKKGVTLIVTADVGISDAETVAYAHSKGIDVIVTDHHTPPEALPDACAVVNPQRVDDFYPNIHLCGAGVAFKLAQALFAHAREQKKKWIQDVPEGWEKWLLDLVAIATVADMMPLTGENRALVHYGLFVLRKTRRPGVVALFKRLRIAQPFVSEDDIGFSIGPRINASSRMGSPETAFTLLTTSDEAEALALAKELDSLNNKRKGSVAHIVRELKKRFSEEEIGEAVLVAGNPEWNPALLGLAANTIADTFQKTVCLWGREGTGNIKGSCRGVGGVHIVDMFREVADELTQFGGHEHAGGFGVSSEKVHTLGAILNRGYAKLCDGNEQGASPLEVDGYVSLPSCNTVHKTLTHFAPFGVANERPLFVYENVHVESVKQFGTDDLHFEMHIAPDAFEKTVRAIAFFKNGDSFSTPPASGDTVTVLGSLELSRFRGRVAFEVRIVDILS